MANYVTKVEGKMSEQNRKVSKFNSPETEPTPTPYAITFKKKVLDQKEEEWGVARQIDEKTWTIKIGEDNKMTTANELFEALNNYRERHGSGKLSWDQNLADFAQKRAENFSLMGRLDGHKGFEEYVENEENVKKLGFWSLGENSSSGYKMLGVHLIEWIYAGDKPHNDNQLEPTWTHVGIGISETATDLIFANSKM